MPLLLKNPHSVLAALETRPQDVFEIRLSSANAGETWEAVRTFAMEIGVRITGDTRRGGREKKKAPGRTSLPEALLKERPELPPEHLFSEIGDTDLYLALDSVQDPQNLGAIFRTAAFFGVKGILLTRDRSAPVSTAVYDVASGGIEYVPFSIPANLSRALDFAKEQGLWILGTSEQADTDLDQIEPDRPWLLVLGNENKGIRRLTRDKCDLICKIPSQTAISSLNVSATAAIFIHKLVETPKDATETHRNTQKQKEDKK